MPLHVHVALLRFVSLPRRNAQRFSLVPATDIPTVRQSMVTSVCLLLLLTVSLGCIVVSSVASVLLLTSTSSIASSFMPRDGVGCSYGVLATIMGVGT